MRYLVTLGQGEEEKCPTGGRCLYRDFVASEGLIMTKAAAKGFVDLFIEKRRYRKRLIHRGVTT